MYIILFNKLVWKYYFCARREKCYGIKLTPPLLSPDAIGDMERWTLRNLLLVSFILLFVSLLIHSWSASPIFFAIEVWLIKASPQPWLSESSFRPCCAVFVQFPRCTYSSLVGWFLRGREDPNIWRGSNYLTQLLKHKKNCTYLYTVHGMISDRG